MNKLHFILAANIVIYILKIFHIHLDKHTYIFPKNIKHRYDVNIALMTCALRNIEYSYSKVKQRKNNKLSHSKYGNKVNLEVKNRSHLKLGQLNKGHSNFSTSETQVSNIVKSQKLDLCTISEANLKQNDLTTHNTFEGYNIESQFMKGATESRLVVVIKKGIHYERLYHLERDYISMMWFKVRITRRTYLIIGCVYRQWQLPQNV